ncbi:hypothetical protein AgCh_036077 [Apium graveolens]
MGKRRRSEMYYIPSLCSNIINIGQLSEEGNQVVMRGDFLWVRDSQGNLVMKVKKLMNRLYKIILNTSENKCLLSSCEKESWLWHMRFGDVNYKAMKLMSETKMQALEIVHGDLCGPISPNTTAGNRYVLLLVDDYTRVMWAYLLSHKDEAYGAFKRFHALVETNDRNIRTFRTDRGGEFMSKVFITYCEEAGINRHFTTPYSPQQNGIVERRNRTMIEMARSFLKTMKMPSLFWGEAIRHSIYILNRLPTRAVYNVTPYEAWSRKKPQVGHIKEPGTKAYRLYNPTTKKVLVSRDVCFDKEKSWPWSEETSETGTPLEIFFVLNYDVNEPTDALPEADSDVSADNEQISEGSDSGSTDSYIDNEPRKFRSLRDVYANTEEVEIEDEELLLMGVDEPANYGQAAKDANWQKAMNQEMEYVETTRNSAYDITPLTSVPARPNYSLVLYYAAERPVKKNSLLGRFVNESNAFCDSRFKLIPSIIEGYWMVKRAVGTKACLLGKAGLKMIVSRVQIDVDIGSSSVARSVIDLDLGYGQEEDELPEYILGTVRLSHVTPESAITLKD